MTDIRKSDVFEKGTLSFFYTDADSWRLGRVTDVEDKAGTQTIHLVSCNEDGEDDEEAMQVALPVDKLAPLQEGALDNVNDLLEMTYLHDSVLLHQVRSRYWQDIIYTNIGAIVLALNPYNYTLPLYTDNNMPKYISEKADALNGGSKLPTHNWTVAHDAYWSMRNVDQPQSILVSGESGAGKTEAAKIVTKYLAVASTYYASASEKEGGKFVTDRIAMSSPILEAFGNAKTLRNDNSSRFGKFMKLQFNDKGFLHGCYTINYLLEKSRVVTHGKGERSYHTYYQFLFGASEEDKEKYNLKDPHKFKWMFDGIPVEDQPKENDIEEYGLVRQAFDLVGFTKYEQEIVYSVIAGIMHLQSITFVPKGDKSGFDDAGVETVKFIADLWKIDADTLQKELTSTTTTLRSDTITKPLTATQATEVRDALSKGLYDRVFQWMVDKMNKVLDKEEECPENQWIGLLDIFGFENFQKNSFEQLCINFANEQLQNHYNTCVFNRDMVEYEAEGIETTSIDPPNNQPTLDLIGAKMGLLDLITDQGRTGSDEKFLAAACDKYKKHKSFKVPRIANGTFGVVHYAGEVSYTAKGMREKNLDPLKDSLKLLLRSSELDVLKDFLDPPAEDVKGAKAFNTVGKFFQGSLNSLISMIDETNPHWIRCVKPHSAKKARMFNGTEVMNQLRCAGVLETVKIRQTGYSMRILHAQFWTRYKLLLAEPGEKLTDEVTREGMQKILDFVEFTPEDVQIGKTKVFLKDPAYKRIEKQRNAKLDSLALAVQRFVLVKVSYNRTHCKRLAQSLICMQQCAKAWYSHYTFRVKELEWYNKKLLAASLMQRNARAKQSGRIMFKKKVNYCIVLWQQNLRARQSQVVWKQKEKEHYDKRVETTQLVQRLFRFKTSEAVYQERARDAIDYLDAELEVFREMEEEKRRAEEARKKALRDKIRAQKGLKAKAEPEPVVEEEEEEEEEEEAPRKPVKVKRAKKPVDDDGAGMTSEDSSADEMNTVQMDAQKVQHMLEKQMEFKKLQRHLQQLQQEVDRLKKENKQKEKECTEAKQKAAIAERVRRNAEMQLQKEKTARLSLEQAYAAKLLDEDRAAEVQAKVLEDAAGDYELMQSLAENRRHELDELYKKLESQENETIRLATTSIIRQPFGTAIDEVVRRQLAGICTDVPNNKPDQPAEPFNPQVLIDEVKKVMRNVHGLGEVYKLIKEFLAYLHEMEKAIPAHNCLPKEAFVDHLERPFHLAEAVCRLYGSKKFEDKNEIPTSGLDAASNAHSGVQSIFNMVPGQSGLEKLRKTHEPLLNKIQDRQQLAVHKINKMELLQQDIVMLLSQLDLTEIQEGILQVQAEFESKCTDGEKETRALNVKFQEVLKEQQDPLKQVEAKRKEKEVVLEQLRQSLKDKKRQVMEEFNTLLQTEETVAYILRDYEYLTHVRRKIEVEINRRTQTVQNSAAALAAGAAVMKTESHLVGDLRETLTASLEEMKSSANSSLGGAHELNFQLMQKHFAALEAYYNDVMALQYKQREELIAEDTKLHDPQSQAQNVKASFMSMVLTKEQMVSQQQQKVLKIRENIKATHEVLLKIRERFRQLLDWSHRNRVAEFLARHNKARYGNLISTSAIPNAVETFHWPNLEELLWTGRGQPPARSSSPGPESPTGPWS
jgi:myosin heavy subunit|uniref:Myosin motor domain-containing protein n=1 Tax=Eutreptiella gymnastica TaxID=73025 RepID=A0A7S4G842_9EUGL|mmetsp:Transcript_47174/g.77567  ORF Transcript_47174/g.77567 Transcript_47174/m.77567 type:complete len:1651 (-) Transcript_47174:516-5468(-)